MRLGVTYSCTGVQANLKMHVSNSVKKSAKKSVKKSVKKRVKKSVKKSVSDSTTSQRQHNNIITFEVVECLPDPAKQPRFRLL